MITFPAHPDCTACGLHEQAESPGLPTRLADFGPPRGSVAILFVGQAPGFDEDRAGRSWVGWAGEFFRRLLAETYNMPELADIYLTNACRCRLPANANLTNGCMNRCRPHLASDIRTLLDAYGPGNVVVAALGAKAAWTLTGLSIKKALPYQGRLFTPRDLFPATQVPMFFTWHPAAMEPGKQPELVHSFDIHIRLIMDYLRGVRPATPQALNIQHAPAEIGKPRVISLDIETYGILEGREQTVFHPARSLEVDGIPRGEQVVSVAISWRDAGQVRSAYYNVRRRSDIHALEQALSNLRPGTILAGMNIAFDILYLVYNLPRLAYLFQPDFLALEDLAVLNHLDDDLRPEHGLKALSHLFGTANYTDMPVSTLPNGRKARNGDDPDLMFYNCTDTASGLQIYEKLKDRIPPAQLAGWSADAFRSGIIWCIFYMERAGVTFHMSKLRTLQETLRGDVSKLLFDAAREGYIFGGHKSVASTQGLVRRAFESVNMLDDPRVVFTQRRRDLSSGKANLQLLLRNLPAGNPYRRPIEMFRDYIVKSKLLSAYIEPLLNEPRKGCLPSTYDIAIGHAYPAWYPVPANTRDESDDAGGTRHGRFSAHNPAVQTFPPPVQDTIISRFDGGLLLSYDLSQAELRVPALLSGDPVMLDAFRRGEDLHHVAAAEIWPGLQAIAEGEPGFGEYNRKRQLGKQANFLIQFRGGPRKYIETCRQRLGVEVSLDMAQLIIDRQRRKFAVLVAWQDELINQVVRDGYMRLLTGWRRTFVRDRYIIEETFINEICNYPVQTYAAQILQSAQIEIQRRLLAERVGGVIPAQIHDAVKIDAPPGSAVRADAIAREVLAAPPLWTALCRHYGRDLPMLFSTKVEHPSEFIKKTWKRH